MPSNLWQKLRDTLWHRHLGGEITGDRHSRFEPGVARTPVPHSFSQSARRHNPIRSTTIALQWLAVASVLISAAGLASASPIRGTTVQVYPVTQPDPPVHMPTGVAVDASGDVYIADGVNHRIVVCDPTGKVKHTFDRVASESLSRPFNMRFDAEGRLWIADTGNHRVVVRGADGSLDSIIPGPQSQEGKVADIIDVLPTADGVSAWIVDNDAHLLHKLDLPSKTWRSFGGYGDALGRLQYPVAVAIQPGRSPGEAGNPSRDREGAVPSIALPVGDIYVADSINARIQVFTATGNPLRSIGSLGLTPGHLFRPTGLAIHSDGSIWVSDNTLGVVQAFTPEGRFIDVVRDDPGRAGSNRAAPGGEPLRLSHPMGITFDAQNDLYVVELAENRVRKLRITRSESVPPPPVRAARPPVQQPRDCIACHVDWMPEIRDRIESSLVPLPPDVGSQPYAARQEVCLSCHDGSVVDSRRMVWRDHGHFTGIKPPTDMNVPRRLPLVDGAISCRTCHSAHTRAGSGHTFRDAVFLRVEKHPVELCVSCHASHTHGPSAGMHPLANMNFKTPTELLNAGARFGASESEVTCLACHTAHGAATESLLVMPEQPNRLCLSCHEQIDAAHFVESTFGHPVSGPLRPDQVSTALGLRLGDGSRDLNCLSCHKMHHAVPEESLLATSARSNDLCLDCHADQAPMLGGPHDFAARITQVRADFDEAIPTDGLRPPNTNFAGESPINWDELTNALSQTPAESGSCLFCHSAHRGKGPLLWAATDNPPVRADDFCIACHQTSFAGSGRAAPGGFAGLPPSPDFIHPTSFGGNARTSAEINLPLFDGLHVAETGSISCATCHNVHADTQLVRSMLRLEPSQPTRSLCFECHPDQRTIDASLHQPALLAGIPHADDACGPCHRVHTPADFRSPGGEVSSEPRQVWSGQRHPMWFAPLGPPSVPANDSLCTGCHAPASPVKTGQRPVDGHATAPFLATHIPVPLRNPPTERTATAPSGNDEGHIANTGTSKGLVFFNREGEPYEPGLIGCLTCHNPHGRYLPEELPLLAQIQAADPGPRELAEVNPRENGAMPPASPDQSGQRPAASLHQTGRRPVAPDSDLLTALRAARPMLEPFDPPNACTACHGLEGLLHFINFHSPQYWSHP